LLRLLSRLGYETERRSGSHRRLVAVADELLLTYRVHVDTSTNRPDASVGHSGGETVADIMRTRSIVRPVEGILSVS
jgi:hypothetical protein